MPFHLYRFPSTPISSKPCIGLFTGSYPGGKLWGLPSPYVPPKGPVDCSSLTCLIVNSSSPDLCIFPNAVVSAS